MDLVVEFIEVNWQMFINHLISFGIPEDEAEDYGNELLKKLRNFK